MRRRERPSPEMPPELVKFRPEDWPGEDPAPANWWGNKLDDRWAWSSIQAYRRFQRARREWLVARGEPGVISTFTDEVEYRRRVLEARSTAEANTQPVELAGAGSGSFPGPATSADQPQRSI